MSFVKQQPEEERYALFCEAKRKITAAVALAADYLGIMVSEIEEMETYEAAGISEREYEEEWSNVKMVWEGRNSEDRKRRRSVDRQQCSGLKNKS